MKQCGGFTETSLTQTSNIPRSPQKKMFVPTQYNSNSIEPFLLQRIRIHIKENKTAVKKKIYPLDSFRETILKPKLIAQ